MEERGGGGRAGGKEKTYGGVREVREMDEDCNDEQRVDEEARGVC